MPKRYDAADTVDTATNLLHRLQSEGMVLSDLAYDIEYSTLEPKGQKFPVSATVTIHLIPVHP
jgi:hypothetical protein